MASMAPQRARFSAESRQNRLIELCDYYGITGSILVEQETNTLGLRRVATGWFALAGLWLRDVYYRDKPCGTEDW